MDQVFSSFKTCDISDISVRFRILRYLCLCGISVLLRYVCFSQYIFNLVLQLFIRLNENDKSQNGTNRKTLPLFNSYLIRCITILFIYRNKQTLISI